MSSSPIKESWTCKDTTTEALEEKMSVGGKKKPLYIRLHVNEMTSTAPHSCDMCSGFKSLSVSCQ